MADSIAFVVWLPPMSDAEYARCKFPTKGRDSTDSIHSDFRTQKAVSPLTDAGFLITPIGHFPPGTSEPAHSLKNRCLHGRVAGYLVEINPPACTVGHNRELVNGVPAGARIGLAAFKLWAAAAGCTREGLAAITEENVVLQSVTPTYLFEHKSEEAARYSLGLYRSRGEHLLNKRSQGSLDDKAKKAVFSVPPKAPKGGSYVYTTYIRRRQFTIDAYVKVPTVGKATLKPVADSSVELRLASRARRFLRVGVKVTASWLRDNNLSRISDWVGNDKAYADVFALVRAELRLDEDLRSKQLRAPTIRSLNLTPTQKDILRWHLKGEDARGHDRFCMIDTNRANKIFSATKICILDRTGIDISVPYDAQKKQLYPELADLLKYPGEHQPFEGSAPYIFSRESVKTALERLDSLTELELAKQESSAEAEGSANNQPKQAKSFWPFSAASPFALTGICPKAASLPRRARGIGQVVVDPSASNDYWFWADGEWQAG